MLRGGPRPGSKVQILTHFRTYGADVKSAGFKITGYTPAAFSEASPLVETSNVLSLTSKPGAGRSSKHLRAIQKGSVSAEDTYAVSDVFGLHSQYGAVRVHPKSIYHEVKI